MRRSTVVGVVVALALAGCGQPSMSRDTSRDLQADVAAIRTAVEQGRVFAAKQQLAALAKEVSELLERDRLDQGTAAEIVSSIDAVLAALPLAPEPSPTAMESVSPSPSEDEDGGDGGEGHGNDGGKGKDKDKGGGDEGHGNDD